MTGTHKSSAGFLQTLGKPITTTYNIATRQTFALCLAIDDDLNRIVTRIQRAQSFASNPYLLSVVALSICEKDNELAGLQVDEDCKKMEATMGYDYRSYDMHLYQVPETSRTSQRLNSFLTRFADVESFCSSLKVALDRLESQLKVLPDEYCPSTCAELREQVVYFQESVSDTSIMARRGKEIVQAMVQTVRVPSKTLTGVPII